MSQGNHPRVRSAVTMTTLYGALLLLAVALILPASALAGTTPAGQWVGEVKTPDGEKVKIHLTLEKSGNEWKGTLEDPTIGTTSVSNLKVTETWISFTFKPDNAPLPLHFTGSYIAGNDRVNGTFSLHGSSRFVKFARVPGSEVIALAEGEAPRKPARLRHDYKFAVTGRVSYWTSMHVVKDEIYTLNDITASALNFDATFRWMVMDEFTVFLRYFSGGQNYTDKEDKLSPFTDLNVSSDTYLQLDGMELGIMGYLGNIMMRESKFNPYLTATLGQTSWSLQENGRGSDVIVSNLNPFEGDDWSIGIGLGTEYEISTTMALEFEWLWRYFMTQDELKWDDKDTEWSNTHVWGLSAGLTYGF